MPFNSVSFALKALRKQRMYVAIIAIGMSIALGASLLILSYAHHELSFESSHANAGRVYRIGGERIRGDRIDFMTTTVFPLGPSLKARVPGVEEQVRLCNLGDVTVRMDGLSELHESKFLLTDQSVFSVFSIPLTQGDVRTVLSRPHSVVISERADRALFGEGDPLGQTVTIRDSVILTVTGVMKDLPNTTRIHTDFLASLSTLESMGQNLNLWSDQGTFDAHTFVLLSEGVAPETVDSLLPGLLVSHLGEEASQFSLRTQRLKDLYFDSHFSDELGPSGSLNNVYLLIGVALLLVVMACLNYVNLSTARVFHRRRELLARSISGANRMQLAMQFLAESVILTSISMVAGLVLYELSIPYLEAYIGKSLGVSLSESLVVWLAAPALVFIVGVVAGSYPAIALVRLWPAGVVSRRFSSGSGKANLRRTLVIVQAVIAIGAAGFTVGVQQQLNFIEHFDHGFLPDDIWLFEFDDAATQGQKEILTRELESLGLPRRSLAVNAPGESIMRITTAYPVGEDESSRQGLSTFTGDEEFCRTFGVDLVRGHWLSDEVVADRRDVALLNQTAVELLGLTDPIGAELTTSRGPFTVVGVVKDFCALSLHSDVLPTIITGSSSRWRVLAVDIPDDAPQSTISKIEGIWAGISPHTSLTCRSLVEIMDKSYVQERKFVSLCYISTGLAILIAMLGLLGLISFILERRVREVGIRKSLGAPVMSIVKLLAGEFVVLVLVAGVAAWPLTRYAVSAWLDSYAYRIEYGWLTYSIVVASALVVSLLIVGTKVIRTANTNPADVLRVE